MANIKGSQKRAELADVRRTANRFNKKTARTAIARLRDITDKKDAETFLKKVNSFIDKLAKRNTWHKKKAANLKSNLALHVNKLK
jgi:small subunit ribosomal protein S20